MVRAGSGFSFLQTGLELEVGPWKGLNLVGLLLACFIPVE